MAKKKPAEINCRMAIRSLYPWPTQYNMRFTQCTCLQATIDRKGDSIAIHVILTFLFIELTLLFSRRVLVLLVLGDEIIHVGFGLCEFHLIHTFPGIPMEECLAAEHGGEVLSNPLEHFLDRG